MGLQNVKAPKLIAQAKSALKAGDLSTANELYRKVLARYPGNRRAREGLARLTVRDPRVDELLQLWSSGRVEAALEMSWDLSTDHPTVRDVRAAALRKLGRPLEAIALYDAALQSEEGNAKIWFNSGVVRMEAHQLSKAAEYLETACRLDPAPSHQIALAQCKLDQGYYLDATKICEGMARDLTMSAPDIARVKDMHGTALLQLGDTAKAVECYRQALKRAPQDARVLHNLGLAANAMGQRDDAMTHFRAALASDPRKAATHRSLARLTDYTSEDRHLSQMLALLDKTISPSEEAELRFALFKAFNDLGDHNAAIGHLNRGNKLRRTQLRYDPTSNAALFKRISDLDPPELHKTGTTPCVFIVGLPRSGTTLTEQILSGAPGTSPAGELPNVGHAASKVLRKHKHGTPSRESMEAFASECRDTIAHYAQRSETVLDKMPLNFRWANLVLSALPEAKIVWLNRSELANAWSLYAHYFAGSGNRFSYDLDDIAGMIRCERDLRAKIFARWPKRVHLVNLEQMTTEPEPIVRDLVQFCDLTWSDACLTPHQSTRVVLTASAQQVRQPITPGMSDVDHLPRTYLDPVATALCEQGFQL